MIVDESESFEKIPSFFAKKIVEMSSKNDEF